VLREATNVRGTAEVALADEVDNGADPVRDMGPWEDTARSGRVPSTDVDGGGGKGTGETLVTVEGVREDVGGGALETVTAADSSGVMLDGTLRTLVLVDELCVANLTVGVRPWCCCGTCDAVERLESDSGSIFIRVEPSR
jgi:hypothetical protein